MSIRDARSLRHRPAKEVLLEPIEVQAAEGHIQGLNYMQNTIFSPNVKLLFYFCISSIFHQKEVFFQFNMVELYIHTHILHTCTHITCMRLHTHTQAESVWQRAKRPEPFCLVLGAGGQEVHWQPLRPWLALESLPMAGVGGVTDPLDWCMQNTVFGYVTYQYNGLHGVQKGTICTKPIQLVRWLEAVLT